MVPGLAVVEARLCVGDKLSRAQVVRPQTRELVELFDPAAPGLEVDPETTQPIETIEVRPSTRRDENLASHNPERPGFVRSISMIKDRLDTGTADVNHDTATRRR
jgi:hypothetical protein